MKIEVNEVRGLKDLINLIKDSVNKNPANINESCIYLEATKNHLKITTLENGSHIINLINDLDNIKVLKAGFIYVDFLSLLKRIQSLPKSKKCLFEVKNNQLQITPDRMGSSNINLFHDQEAFKGLIPELSNEIILYHSNCQVNLEAFKLASSMSTGNCAIEFTSQETFIYGSLDQGAFFKITDNNIKSNQEYRINILPHKLGHLVKLQSKEKSNYQFSINTTPHTLQLSKNNSTVTIYGNDIEKGEHLAVQYCEENNIDYETQISRSELKSALEWQLCNSDEELIHIKYQDGELLVFSSQSNPAKIISDNEFFDISLSGNTLLTAINLIKEPAITLSGISLTNGDEYSKVIKISAAEKTDLSCDIYIYEQVLL